MGLSQQRRSRAKKAAECARKQRQVFAYLRGGERGECGQWKGTSALVTAWHPRAGGGAPPCRGAVEKARRRAREGSVRSIQAMLTLFEPPDQRLGQRISAVEMDQLCLGWSLSNQAESLHQRERRADRLPFDLGHVTPVLQKNELSHIATSTPLFSTSPQITRILVLQP